MISIELAKELKDAGLEWEPAPKDDFAYINGRVSWLQERYPAVCDYPERFIWLPRLDQLLDEIEKRGYGYMLIKKVNSCPMVIVEGSGRSDTTEFIADTADEAAGEVLLWILLHAMRSKYPPFRGERHEQVQRQGNGGMWNTVRQSEGSGEISRVETPSTGRGDKGDRAAAEV